MNVQIADLDANGIYWGMKEKDLAEVAAGDIVFGAEGIALEDRIEGVMYLVGSCDLPHGVQKWNPAKKCFEPLKRQDIPGSRATPSLEKALYAQVLVIVRDDVMEVPQATLDWALWYESTLEGLPSRPLATLLTPPADA
jgi:hypothetical protein